MIDKEEYTFVRFYKEFDINLLEKIEGRID